MQSIRSCSLSHAIDTVTPEFSLTLHVFVPRAPPDPCVFSSQYRKLVLGRAKVLYSINAIGAEGMFVVRCFCPTQQILT